MTQVNENGFASLPCHEALEICYFWADLGDGGIEYKVRFLVAIVQARSLL